MSYKPIDKALEIRLTLDQLLPLTTFYKGMEFLRS